VLFFEYALFWFVLLGSKLLLGIIVIYQLLPKDRQCATCDAEILPLASPRLVTRLLRLARIQRYWCIECDRQSLGRPMPSGGRTHSSPLRPVPQVRSR
jgi:hypothetical protein